MSSMLDSARGAVMLAALAAGAYLIVMRLPPLLEPTPLTDFPVLTTLLALFAFLSLTHTLLSGLSALAAGRRPKS